MKLAEKGKILSTLDEFSSKYLELNIPTYYFILFLIVFIHINKYFLSK